MQALTFQRFVPTQKPKLRMQHEQIFYWFWSEYNFAIKLQADLGNIFYDKFLGRLR